MWFSFNGASPDNFAHPVKVRRVDRRTNALPDQPTNQPTDQPMDTAGYRGALSHLKKCNATDQKRVSFSLLIGFKPSTLSFVFRSALLGITAIHDSGTEFVTKLPSWIVTLNFPLTIHRRWASRHRRLSRCHRHVPRLIIIERN